jgi:hypothetical protein
VAAAGPSAAELASWMEDGGGVVRASASGYLQFIRHDVLVQFAAEADAVISLSYRPGHFLVQGHPVALVWPPGAAAPGERGARPRAHHRAGPDAGRGRLVRVDQLVEGSEAVSLTGRGLAARTSAG